jgi:hypothetical protein
MNKEPANLALLETGFASELWHPDPPWIHTSSPKSNRGKLTAVPNFGTSGNCIGFIDTFINKNDELDILPARAVGCF